MPVLQRIKTVSGVAKDFVHSTNSKAFEANVSKSYTSFIYFETRLF